jgi:hypothetical protein
VPTAQYRYRANKKNIRHVGSEKTEGRQSQACRGTGRKTCIHKHAGREASKETKRQRDWRLRDGQARERQKTERREKDRR